MLLALRDDRWPRPSRDIRLMAPVMAGRNGHPCCTEWGDLRTGMRQHPVLHSRRLPEVRLRAGLPARARPDPLGEAALLTGVDGRPGVRLLREIIATCSNSRTGSADWALPSVTWWSDGPSPVSAAEPCGCRACHLCVSSLAGC